MKAVSDGITESKIVGVKIEHFPVDFVSNCCAALAIALVLSGNFLPLYTFQI